MGERGGATRYNFGAIAEVIDLDQRDALVSLTRDLSLSGCFVETTTPYPEGTLVRVRIFHSGAEFVAVGNVTANVTPTGMGIAFTEIQPNDRAILERWLGSATRGKTRTHGGTMPNTRDQFQTILIADDIEANRALLTEILSAEHYRIVQAEDGEQAMQLLEEGEVDLALLDVMMPGRTGFAVCRALKSNPETRLIPLVLVTSLSASEDRVQGIESGADDFLNKPVNKEELLARVRSLLKLKQFTDELEHAEAVLFALALSIEAKDPYTEGHCDRLSESSEALAARLSLSEEERIALRRGGVIHDIGKVAVPDQILLKPGPLTPEERKVMQQHTVVGAGICSPLKSFRSVLPIIRHHHEKIDGSGYPDGLKGDAIPLTARILQTVDIYDALTTDRPYRNALPAEKALAIMREEVRRGWWDGTLVNELEAMVHGSALSN